MFRRFRCATEATPQDDVGALFARYHHKLRNRVRAIVRTSDANVEDACMYAWLQFLSDELDGRSVGTSWLTTVAIREAVKLDRAERRDLPAASPSAEAVDRADPRDHYAARDLVAYAAAVIRDAGLTGRQLQIISLQLWGLSYEQIAANTGDSLRTVERQVLRANHKIAEVLEHQGG